MQERSFPIRVVAVFLVMVMMPPMWLLGATPGPILPDPGRTGMTKEQQEQLGLQAMGEVYKQMPVLPDSNPISQYVQQLGKKLEAVIPAEYSWPYQFHVVQQKEINAFALPGGPMFVNVGTITAADNEAELVGVMAHEMSHVYMQHSAKQAPKQNFAQLLGALGTLLGGGTLGTLAQLGIQLGAGTVLLKYSREDEAQADAVGAIIMYKAGYNPKAMADFFQKLEQQGGGGGPQFLSDHPNPGNRQANIDKEIEGWPPRNYTPNTPTFVSTKQAAASVKVYTGQQIAEGAKAGTWQRQNQETGATPKNLPPPPSGSNNSGPGDVPAGPTPAQLANVTYEQVKPSGSLTRLQNNVFTMLYPANWRASNDANGGVTIAPPAGAAQGMVAYGVLVNGAQMANGSSITQATESLVQGLVQSNPGMQASGSSSIKVNGVRGRSVTLMGNSPIQQNGQPLRERDWLVTLPTSQGAMLYLVFVAPDQHFSSLRSTYKKMLNSLQMQ